MDEKFIAIFLPGFLYILLIGIHTEFVTKSDVRSALLFF
jgi:hypothetical protein